MHSPPPHLRSMHALRRSAGPTLVQRILELGNNTSLCTRASTGVGGLGERMLPKRQHRVNICEGERGGCVLVPRVRCGCAAVAVAYPSIVID